MDTTVKFCIFELAFISNFALNIFGFLDHICQEGHLLSKTEKVIIMIQFCIFELDLVPNFSLNWQFWFSGPNLPKKGFSGLKQKKWIQPLNSAYPN